MPELPEVETARRIVDKFIKGQRITGAWTLNDPIVFANASHLKVRKALIGHRVTTTGRKGKHMWIALDSGQQIAFHLGMTGSFKLHKDTGQRPRFTRLAMQREDGIWIAFVNKRRLGRIRLHDDIIHEPPVAQLGWDPMESPPSPADFFQSLQKRRTPIKALLLNQQFIAGIGNWIADEILFQARIHPAIHANQLTRTESNRILKKMLEIIQLAVRVNADDSKFPSTWLFHHRWGKNTEAKTSSGDTLDFITVGGRTTAYVPAKQKKSDITKRS